MDYSADLGRLVQTLTKVDERLKAVEQSPVLRQGAEHYARVLQGSGDELVRAAVRELGHQAIGLGRTTYDLMVRMKGARERQLQDRWLAGLAGAGLVAGVLATLFAPRFLPVPVAPYAASLVMGKDAWDAGMDLMEFGSQASWNRRGQGRGLPESRRGDEKGPDLPDHRAGTEAIRLADAERPWRNGRTRSSSLGRLDRNLSRAIRMNHSDLVGVIAEKHSLSKADAKAIVETVFATLVEAAARNEDVSVNGFGKFKVKESAARQGRNPATGATVEIAASRKLALQPAKALKDRLNG